MAKPAPSLPKIKLNLLHPQGVSQKLPERFIKWLISYGRFIVIVVEVVVIGAFIMRFSLDAKLDQLKKEINKDIPFVMSLEFDEALIRQTQQRLTIIGKELDNAKEWTNILSNLSKNIPEKVILTNLNIEKDPNSPTSPLLQFKLTAQTNSNIYLGQLLSELKNDPNLKDIALANVNYEEGKLIFSITGSTKK